MKMIGSNSLYNLYTSGCCVWCKMSLGCGYINFTPLPSVPRAKSDKNHCIRWLGGSPFVRMLLYEAKVFVPLACGHHLMELL